MKALFRKYLNSTCNPQEIKEVVNYIGNSGNNKKITENLRANWLKDLKNSSYPEIENPELLKKIHQSISRIEFNQKTRLLNIYRISLRIAAVLIVGLIITTVLVFKSGNPSSHVQNMHNVTIPHGARTNLTLPDGSLVWLNSGSEFSYPSEFGDQRKVSLRGEAYFEVVKKGKPFSVSTEYGEVEVMGTSFNVQAYLNSGFVTTLEEGSVKVYNKNRQGITLLPGQQANISGNKQFKVKQVNTSFFTAWKDGKLIFSGESLQNVARKLERWYNVKIQLDENVKNIETGFTGTIELESFSEVLELIKTISPIEYSFNKDTRIIKIVKRKNS